MNLFEESLSEYLSTEILSAIRSVRVGIAGAGGLGSNCANCLVRLGFNKLTIVDFDTVSFSNLNRQFFFYDQTGQPKVSALKENLTRINPDIAIKTFSEKITAENADRLFNDCDIIVEAFDNPESKRMIVEKFAETGKLVVAATGLAGWENIDSIVTRKVNSNMYIIGDFESAVSKNLPPLSPRVTIAAAKEANAVLEWIINNRKTRNER